DFYGSPNRKVRKTSGLEGFSLLGANGPQKTGAIAKPRKALLKNAIRTGTTYYCYDALSLILSIAKTRVLSG
ncbi:MAG: hypothetical protein LBC67_05145, partial [Spirochaetales bacterium]|nr:hypothetical protein [Spirochaetales bacterium]